MPPPASPPVLPPVPCLADPAAQRLLLLPLPLRANTRRPQLVLICWRTRVLESLPKLMPAVLEQIDESRRGAAVDWGTLSGVIGSLVTIGDALSEQDAVQVYSTAFERDFVHRTREFYTAEAGKFLRDNSVADYMRKVQGRLREEQMRTCTRARKPK